MLSRVPDAPLVERDPGLARAAWLRARAVVGLYGDPTVPWSIVLQAELSEPIEADAVRARLAALAERYPHLGGAPSVIVADRLDDVRTGFASQVYDGRDPLVRVALAGSPPALLVAAHHGAVDGLGLLALLGAAVDLPVRTSVVGMRDRAIARSFALAAARRVGEAVFAPPVRVRAVPSPGPSSTEVLVAARLPHLRAGTAAVTAAAAAVVRDWNAGAASGRSGAEPAVKRLWLEIGPAGRRGRVVAAIGASRRDGDDLTPEHRAAYLRLRLPPGADRALVRTMLENQRLEPDFPPSRNVVVRLGSRALARRLGATFLVSNLGAVEIGTPVAALTFFPQPSGPSGVAIGVVSTAGATTLTVRARRRDFTAAAAADLLDRLVARVGR
jgi:hypothetical protein